MNWSNLKENKCPKCGKDISGAFDRENFKFNCTCGFVITAKRFKEIVSNVVQKEYE
jgi:hypothetical protein